MLLLDDVASELDEVRRERLFAMISGKTYQTVITVTERRLLPELPGRVDWHGRAISKPPGKNADRLLPAAPLSTDGPRAAHASGRSQISDGFSFTPPRNDAM